jgi:oxygen-dependent protoporphyrinogen oxidase
VKRVVIIGAGIAGLTTAFSMREHGKGAAGDIEVLVIERSPRVGGNILTETVDGFVIEGGPDCFLSEKPWAMELAKRLGLEHRLLATNDETRKTFVYSGGRLHELPEGVILMVPTRIAPLAMSGLMTLRGKLRMAIEVFVPRRKDGSDETLGSFVRRRLGQEALDKIAEPLVAGVHAGDPETMSVRASFPRFVELEEQYGSLILGMLKRMRRTKKAPAGRGPKAGGRVTMFMTLRGGLSELTGALEGALSRFEKTRIMTGAAATYVREKGGGYEIGLESGPSIEADAVVVTAPAYAASSLLSGLDQGLSQGLLSIPYASTATVSLGFRRSGIKHPLNGFGFVVPRSEKRGIMASTWTSVKFDHRAPEGHVLLRCFVGGSKDPSLLALDDAGMIRMALGELRLMMGIEAEPVLARVFRWKDSMPQYTVGHEARVASIEEAASRHPGLFLTGSAYRGIGISDNVRNAEVAAKKVLHYLGGDAA